MSLSTTQEVVRPRRAVVADQDGLRGDRLVPRPYLRWKGPLERVAAFILLVLFLPLILVLVAIVRLTSRGPAIFRQVRVGRDGKHYTMYKIRTMRCNAEQGSGAVWALQNDHRATPVGHWLRRLHLDELPQLWNVIRGEMSLVGPRPERPEFTQLLIREIHGYRDRMLALPGITGLAQINLPPDTDLNSVRRKLYLDRQYIETASMALDFRMLMCSALRLVGLPGSWAMVLMRLQRLVPDAVIRHESSEPVAPSGNGHGTPPVAHRDEQKPAAGHDQGMSGHASGNGHARPLDPAAPTSERESSLVRRAK